MNEAITTLYNDPTNVNCIGIPATYGIHQKAMELEQLIESAKKTFAVNHAHLHAHKCDGKALLCGECELPMTWKYKSQGIGPGSLYLICQIHKIMINCVLSNAQVRSLPEIDLDEVEVVEDTEDQSQSLLADDAEEAESKTTAKRRRFSRRSSAASNSAAIDGGSSDEATDDEVSSSQRKEAADLEAAKVALMQHAPKQTAKPARAGKRKASTGIARS